LGAVTVTTNASGVGPFSFVTSAPQPGGRAVTSTEADATYATDAAGNASEFSERVLSP
jgi:hypothetical protein